MPKCEFIKKLRTEDNADIPFLLGCADRTVRSNDMVKTTGGCIFGW